MPGVTTGLQGFPGPGGWGSWKAEERKGIQCQKLEQPLLSFRKEGSPEKGDRSQPKGDCIQPAVHAVVPSRAGDTAKPHPASKATDELHPQSDLKVTLKINKVGPRSQSRLTHITVPSALASVGIPHCLSLSSCPSVFSFRGHFLGVCMRYSDATSRKSKGPWDYRESLSFSHHPKPRSPLRDTE